MVETMNIYDKHVNSNNKDVYFSSLYYVQRLVQSQIAIITITLKKRAFSSTFNILKNIILNIFQRTKTIAVTANQN